MSHLSGVSEIIDFSSPVPIIFRRRATDWDKNEPILNKLLSGELRGVKTLWRVCPLKTRRTIREYESVFITATFEEFDAWFNGKIPSEETKEGVNPFKNIPSRSDGVVSVYADYKHFNELFHTGSIPKYGSMIDLFGALPEKNNSTEETSEYDRLTALFAPENLTLWLSTHGAHTPLHYDSYGCNVVTQVKGSKRWQLWSPNSLRHSIPSQQTPPSSSSSSSFSPRLQKSSSLPISSTHPTSSQTNQKLPCLRIPYEESSVYSTYDPRQYNNKKVGYIPPDYDITLTEGDILFVPKHFWHFVETLDAISLSINLWLPYPMPVQPSFSNIKQDLSVKCDKVLDDLEEKREGEPVLKDEECGSKSEIVTDNRRAESVSDISITENSKTKPQQENIDIELNNTKIHEKTEKNCIEGGYNRGHSPCFDPQSRVMEALSRVLYGALKGSASCVFDTDCPRSGWLNPSEQGGTLDFTAWNSPLSSSTREECEENNDKNYNDGNDNNDDSGDGDDVTGDDDGDNGVTLDQRAPDDGPDNTRIRGVHTSDIKKWQLMDKSARLHLEYLYNSLKDQREEERKEGGEEGKKLCIGTEDKPGQEIDFEAFLKRFFNALLDPEIVERCLLRSIDSD